MTDSAPIKHRLEFPCYPIAGAYDEKGFSGYPERMGWTLDIQLIESQEYIRIYREDGSIPDKAELAAFLQAWLFMGMLTEVMRGFGQGVRIESDFIRWDGGTSGEGRRVFTLILLDRHLEDWGLAGIELEQVEMKRRIDMMMEWLETASNMIWEEEQNGVLGSPMIGNLSEEVLEPMQVLAEILEGACEFLLAAKNGDSLEKSRLVKGLRNLSTFETPMRRLPGKIVDNPEAWYSVVAYEHMSESRKLALRRLGEVYEKAEVVLVLDNELQLTDYRTSNEEIGIRICESNWMRRLWTMEEGILGRSRLMFQFCGKAMPLPAGIESRAIDSYNNETEYLGSPTVLTEIAHHLFSHLPERPRLGSNTNSVDLKAAQLFKKPINPLSIMTALRYRKTSKKEDETLCIGSILGLDLASLVSHRQAHSRMKAFFDLLQQAGVKVSSAILFSEERKLSEPGYGWVPASLMTLWDDQERNLHPFFTLWTSHDEQEFTSRGLYSTLSYYLFNSEHSLLALNGELLTEYEHEVRVWREWLPQCQRATARAEDPVSPSSLFPFHNQSVVSNQNSKLAIVLNPKLRASVDGVLVLINTTDRPVGPSFGPAQSSLDGLALAKYLCRVKSIDLAEHPGFINPDSRQHLTAVTRLDDQRLCIG
ncbi:MAG: hypothetical protein Q9195_006772 [Heterodermia aff. obscurata]